MKQYALWKRFSVYSIILFLIPVTAFLILYNSYTVRTVRQREQLRYRQNCDSYVRSISALVNNIRNLSYNAIYAKDSLFYMEKALEVGDDYEMPENSARSIDILMEAQDYATNIVLYTGGGVCYLQSGIGADEESEPDAFFSGDDTQSIDEWTGLRLIRREYPYSDYVSCISYYRIVTRLRSVEPLGYCRIDVPELSLRALYSAATGTASFLVDSSGRILSASAQNMLGGSVSALLGDELRERLADDPDDEYVLDIGGSAYYMVSRVVSRTGWTFVSYIPLDSLTYGSRRLSAMLTGLMMGCCLVFIATQMLAARLITRPLKQLADEMDLVCSGRERRIAPPPRGNETQMLINSFENMKSRIDYLTQTVYASQIEELRVQVKYLQTQINPHFLYNALDSIRFSARLNSDLTTAAQIEALSDIYRSITHEGTSETVAESLSIARKFSLLMQNQTDMNIAVHEDVDPALLDQKIPKLMIQPVLENSYLHGFRGMSRERGNIWISVRETAAGIVIEVRDDGMGADADRITELLRESGEPNGLHLALKNIHSRIRIYFGDAYGVVATNRPGGGMIIRIGLPGREEMNRKEWI